MMAAPAAAEEIFGRCPNRPKAARDRHILTVAAGLERFTLADVVRGCHPSRPIARLYGSYYGAAQRICQVLWMEGHLRRVSGERCKPVVYEWVEP